MSARLIVKLVITLIQVLGVWSSITMIGKERKPLTPHVAAIMVFISAAIVLCVWRYL